MSGWTRRTFLAASAAIPFSLWLEKHAAWAQGPYVRHDARSAQGQAMLAVYADAVEKMKGLIHEQDPRSWVFQWYIHGVNDKAGEIQRIYPQPSPQRDLAQDTWYTCQAHLGQPEDYFLPWHRMYVYFFETIIRQVSGNPAFTLPYWNYSTPDTSIRGVLPPQFRLPGDPTYGSLYVANRNPGVNSGRPIQQGQPNDPLSLSALSECTYSPQGARQGFCARLDFPLHGNIHVLVGTTTNMGNVPTAANDPIFWAHHCNIDRLWASWNAGGRQNPNDPTFLDKTFVFADASGQRVVAKISDFLAIAPLGYGYDRLEPVPPCPLTLSEATPKTYNRATAAVSLGSAPVKVTLAAPATAAAQPLAERVAALPANRHLYLVVSKLKADLQPGTLYHVYLELPDDATGEQREHYLVGSLNFFDAAGHGGHGEHAAAAGSGEGKFYSFDVTDLARELAAAGKLGAEPSLTVLPGDQPEAEAQPVVGEMSLVEQ